MKALVLLLALFMVTSLSAQTARTYFAELYKAGSLDNMEDEYVCFDDDSQLDTFFSYSYSKDVRMLLKASGDYTKLPKKMQNALRENLLAAKSYDKGVAIGNIFYHGTASGAWVTDQFMLDKQTPAKLRLDIEPATMRYKRSLQILNMDLTLKDQQSRHGKCEEVARFKAQN